MIIAVNHGHVGEHRRTHILKGLNSLDLTWPHDQVNFTVRSQHQKAY